MCINADAHRRAYGSPYSHPDERKIHLSPRSTSHTPSSTPHYHQPPTSTKSPSTPPQSSSTAGRRDTPATSAAKVPLTRRKWLESSIPGLIFGGGGEEERREGASDGKEHAISSDDHERQSSMRSQPAVPSSRCKLSLYIEKHGKARVQGYLCFNCFLLRLLACMYPCYLQLVYQQWSISHQEHQDTLHASANLQAHLRGLFAIQTALQSSNHQ